MIILARIKSQDIQYRFTDLRKTFKNNWDLYLLILPALVYIVAFHYLPMYGIQIAFKRFMVSKGIWNSPWLGLDHFIRFFKSYNFWVLIKNTLGLSLYQLAVGFPAPILLALLLNEVKNKHFKKTIQTITYAPNFLSVVVVVGMATSFLSTNGGIVNEIIKAFGKTPVFFMGEASWFKTIYVITEVWQKAGWNSIIYIAALTTIDVQLYEAADIEGASKLQKLWYITLPCIIPTAITLLILNTGQMMNIGFEKVFLMQNG